LVVEAGVQWPALSQVAAALSVAALHVAEAQGVPTGYWAQCPAPSQRPFVPQLAAVWSVQTWAGSGAAAATGWQVPAFPDTAQERQLPHDGPLEQQTPSVQNVLRHSLPEAQDAPSALRLTQEPDWQVYPEAQSLAEAHMVRQALVVELHTYALQLIVGCAQLPRPSQAPTGLAVDPEQLAVPQLVPGAPFRQAPLPSQVPSNPHGGLVAVQAPCGSVLPAGIGWQEPVPLRLQAAHVPQLAAEQQTPSTQLPLPHSVPKLQIWPRRLRPQAPALQTLPGEQSALVAQTETHAVPVSALQANGTQDCVEAALQTPAPSQVRADVAVTPPVGQEAPAHWVPAAYSWQAPLPLQKPVVPQLADPCAVHCPAGSGPLAGTGEQVPAVPVRAQDIQVPLHEVPQQIPWAQMVLLHSVPLEQTAPFGLSPHDPPLQEAGIAQSLSVAQVALQAFVPQANGKQEDDAGTPQVPAPSQVPPGVKVVPVAGQVAAWHEVPCWYFSQAPAWHLPSVPQLAAPLSTQLPAGSGPEATAVHCPIVPVIAHDRQAPVQAVAQQTPWAQNVD
jgi:hypothetical protein